MIDFKKVNEKYDYVVSFKKKIDDDSMTDQDKKHIRILAILRLTRENQITNILSHTFDEKFIYDKENKTGYYCIRIHKRKEGKIYADC